MILCRISGGTLEKVAIIDRKEGKDYDLDGRVRRCMNEDAKDGSLNGAEEPIQADSSSTRVKMTYVQC